jgi:hypothetical protein
MQSIHPSIHQSINPIKSNQIIIKSKSNQNQIKSKSNQSTNQSINQINQSINQSSYHCPVPDTDFHPHPLPHLRHDHVHGANLSGSWGT